MRRTKYMRWFIRASYIKTLTKLFVKINKVYYFNPKDSKIPQFVLS